MKKGLEFPYLIRRFKWFAPPPVLNERRYKDHQNTQEDSKKDHLTFGAAEETPRSRPWAHGYQVVENGKNQPGKEDGYIKFEVRDNEGPLGNLGLKGNHVGRMGKVPDGTQIKQKE